MSTVKVGENESIDNALRRFKRKCARDGIIGDLRKREAYEKPSVKRKKKGRSSAQAYVQKLIWFSRQSARVVVFFYFKVAFCFYPFNL